MRGKNGVEATHEPHPLTPSLFPNGGEGARRADEGDAAWFIVSLREHEPVEAPHEPERRPPARRGAAILERAVPEAGVQMLWFRDIHRAKASRSSLPATKERGKDRGAGHFQSQATNDSAREPRRRTGVSPAPVGGTDGTTSPAWARELGRRDACPTLAGTRFMGAWRDINSGNSLPDPVLHFMKERKCSLAAGARGAVLLLMLFLAVQAPAGTLAQFRTVFGDIEVELHDRDKPVTVKNFIRYVQSGFYADGIIHRCDPTFVIQGGGFFVEGRGTTNQVFAARPAFVPIPNEYGAGTIYSNRYGTIAMAKIGGNTNSASSQWFFNLANNFGLDAHDSNNFFTVFGHVVRGTNVLNVFKTFKTTSTTTNVIRDLRASLGSAFGELPLLTAALRYDDLVYVDISLLNVGIAQTGGGREISWNSVKDKTNRVEFTTMIPPSWQTLVTTNGTGSPMTVTDASASDPERFYRVRVDY